MRLYIAGSWENRAYIKDLMEVLTSRGHIITVDWTVHESQHKATEYATEDIQGIKDCDTFIYCHDAIKSGGKVYELGFAHALEKKIIIYGGLYPTDQTKNIWGTGCVFIRADLHQKAETHMELFKLMEGQNHNAQMQRM